MVQLTYDDSSPPSTPDSRDRSALDGGHPSTTPVGPPPGSMPSTTPAGPPPSSVFGSSAAGPSGATGRVLFGGPKPTNKFGTGGFGAGTTGSSRFPPGTGTTFGAVRPIDSSPPQVEVEDDAEGEEDEDDYSYDSEEEHDEADMMEDDADMMDEYEDEPEQPTQNTFQSSAFNEFAQSHPSKKPATRAHAMHGIAKGIAARTSAMDLEESDTLILETEKILSGMCDALTEERFASEPEEDPVLQAAIQLRRLYEKEITGVDKADDAQGPGPGEGAEPLAKAEFIASLLLGVHIPCQTDNKDVSDATNPFAMSRFGAEQQRDREIPIPKVLLNWLNLNHDSSYRDLNEVLAEENGYSAADNFWDVIFSSLFKGKFDVVIQLLKGANLSRAATALQDGLDEPGYHGVQLKNAQLAINEAIVLLQTCPALESGDWDVKGNEWMLFRRRVEDVKADLEVFAEGKSQDHEDDEDELYGLKNKSGDFNLSTRSRHAESQVPWTVYECLKDMYNQLLGNPEDLLKSAYDWVEAVVGLTVWWDGDDHPIEKDAGLSASRRSYSRHQKTRTVDITPGIAYRQRLASSLDYVMTQEDAELAMNKTSSLEVAIASIFDGDISAAVVIIQKWSIVIAAAVAEIASAGEWLEDDASKRGMQAFDQDDLMVLGISPEEATESMKDEILCEYARLLCMKETLRRSKSRQTTEGWEIGLQVLGRLDNTNTARTKIEELIARLDVASASRCDKLLDLCAGMGLTGQAHHVAEKYADSLTENSSNYGDAIFYYARAHNTKKLRNVLDLLISLCLVQSTSYPPISELDPRLKDFILKPQETLSDISQADFDAAQMLATCLSGYAALRNFYDLRDAEILSGGTELQKPKMKPLERKRAAATALVALVESAGDSIHGGLYDPEVEVVVQVDGLLTLLGEALPFVNQPTRYLTLPQTFSILRALEDLSTVGSRIYNQCEECFQSALANAYGAEPPSPRNILRKSVSALTASSQFSLVGSEMLVASGTGSGSGVASTEGSGVLVQAPGGIKRGWDWRKGLKKDAKGMDVMKMLRLALSEEVGRAWAGGEQ
ncbi:hypothetical protein K402DRAFT_394494 [Aulographum hederae CBS 113979]|uniref:Nuclear pore complex protein Nup85 n=1 Tax=Aulographum hederae CBS 113979 TaxID=1176131 RepID=A0A6G1GX27_9PEZI|nr:hypothetical protein K402DRAFT_394494 [Aulographum hederae CBS 113979]